MKTINITPTAQQKEEFIKGLKGVFEAKMKDELELLNRKFEKDKKSVHARFEKDIEKLKDKYKKLQVIIPNEDGDRKVWTPKDKHLLVTFFQDGAKLSEIAKFMKRSGGSINQQIQKLKKDPKYMDQMKRIEDTEKRNKEEKDFDKIPEFVKKKK